MEARFSYNHYFFFFFTFFYFLQPLLESKKKHSGDYEYVPRNLHNSDYIKIVFFGLFLKNQLKKDKFKVPRQGVAQCLYVDQL